LKGRQLFNSLVRDIVRIAIYVSEVTRSKKIIHVTRLYLFLKKKMNIRNNLLPKTSKSSTMRNSIQPLKTLLGLGEGLTRPLEFLLVETLAKFGLSGVAT